MSSSMCLFAILFVACQVHAQGSAESDVILRVTMHPNETGHMITQVTQDNESSGKCLSSLPSVEVEASTSSCSGPSSRQHVQVTITLPPPSPIGLPTTTPPTTMYAMLSPPSCPPCPAPSCPTCPAPSCPSCPPPPPSTTTASPAVLLSGYEHIPNLGCYKYHTAGAQWVRAKKICEEEGSHLAIINSEAESKAISNIMKRDLAKTDHNGNTCWLGLIESYTNQHEYFTIFGDPLATTGFSRWTPGRPRYPTLGDNVFLDPRDGSLSDAAGKSLLPFACEQFTC